MGPTKFAAGPLALLVDIVVSCDLTSFYSYLVLSQGQLRSLIRWGHLMTSKDQQDYASQLERMRASVQHWLYSTLVFASGLFATNRNRCMMPTDRSHERRLDFPCRSRLLTCHWPRWRTLWLPWLQFWPLHLALSGYAATQPSPSPWQCKCTWCPFALISRNVPP